ncbi:MAG TPA: T9SS type A sorting domain-containing protein [candidate division WOR-3 bacterium]|uniref:T9SS type A sorting domain-containing protein n=1 Tax=candidate division WOR-3 bacterium TaxID=2052148 RepID=A0A7V0T561_UNCW3|nr:T9SS type A sorting domain-containing protein [candidate division WOR-3 bacterium]
MPAHPVTNGTATLRFESLVPRLTVNVYDVAGSSVFATRLPGHSATGTLTLDLRTLGAGVYLVRVEASGFSSTRKLTIR